jgi:hypothetical protein
MDAHGFTVDCVHGELLAERQAVIGRTRRLKRHREIYMVRDVLGKAEEAVSAGFLRGKGFGRELVAGCRCEDVASIVWPRSAASADRGNMTKGRDEAAPACYCTRGDPTGEIGG